MPKFVVERTVPGAGRMDAGELHALAASSNKVLAGKAGNVQWVHSHVAEDRLFRVYNADSPELIREHARIGGFPCDRSGGSEPSSIPSQGGRDGGSRAWGEKLQRRG